MMDVNISMLYVRKVITVHNVVKYLFYGKRGILNHFNLPSWATWVILPQEVLFSKE